MKYSKIYALLLAAMVTAGSVSTAMAQSSTPKVHGNVYGGGNEGNVGQSVTVNISGGTLVKDVYGGGALAETNTANWDGSTFTQTFHAVTLAAGTPLDGYYTDAAGTTPATGNADGSTTYYKKTETIVKLTGGTVTQDVYGGGYGDKATIGDGHQDKPANVYGSVTVTVEGGSVTNVYGCNNQNGTPKGDVVVNIKGGTISKDVYGGGNLADAEPSITVNVSGGTVTNDVYGGGALANTNTKNWDSTGGTDGNGAWAAGGTSTDGDGVVTTTNKTTVNLTGGTVGNAYGGGLGNGTTPAYVYGDVAVTVNGTAFTKLTESTGTGTVPKTGRVFGCNNINGTPKGSVTVTIVQTTREDGGEHQESNYEIQAVYGGGNLAAYVPATDNQKTKVEVQGCNNSIEYVYGGGNSAPVPETDVTIRGAFEIDCVFGGGNGSDKVKVGDEWQDSPGANVGGDTNTALYGGKIHSVFGGSNKKGTIAGNTNLNIPEITDETGCPLKITDVYGAGREADVDHDVILEIGCLADGVENVYGGAFNANIKGKVQLTITSGILQNVFGGNNSGGTIEGPIVVNIEETDNCKPIKITNLYGAGNAADYPSSDPTVSVSDPSVTVNVKACTKIDNIYGGGLSAAVYGDTEVNINMVKGWWANKHYPATSTDESTLIPNTIGTIGNVYGGGENGNVYYSNSESKTHGNATVNIGTEVNVGFVTEPIQYRTSSETALTPNSTTNLYDIPVEGAKIVGNVFGGGFGSATTVNGTAQVNLGASGISYTPEVTGNVYGGSAMGTVNVTEVNLVKGTVAINGTDTNTGNVFGGGMGQNADPDATPAITESTAHVTGSTTVTLNGATVQNAIYGGCNANGVIGTTGTAADAVSATILLKNGIVGNSAATDMSVLQTVFGGGLGANTHTYGSTAVNVGEVADDDVQIYGNVYGGSKNGSIGAVAVDLKAGTIHGNVYGGGYQTTANTTYVTQATDATSTVNVTVEGTKFEVSYDETDATIVKTGQVFGCNNKSGSPTGHVTVDVKSTSEFATTQAIDLAAVYGGGNEANYIPAAATEKKYTEVNISRTPATTGRLIVGKVFGGGNAAGIGSDGDGGIAAGSQVTLTDGEVKNGIYGGCNTSGTITGTATVILSGGTVGTSGTIGDLVFGGGYGHGTTTNTAIVNVGTKDETADPATYSGTSNIYSNVYGGSALGEVGTATVNLNKATTLAGDVFGGGMGSGEGEDTRATISTSATVWQNNIQMADGKNIYGGCNENGIVNGAATVNLIGGGVHDVFGGGKGNHTSFDPTNGSVQVNVGTSSSVGSTNITGDIYGGSAFGHVTAPEVNLYKVGSFGGNVFGGGKGQIGQAADNTDPSNPVAAVPEYIASVSGTATVNMYAMTINDADDDKAAIYGGCNVNGTATAAIVNLIGGTIGTAPASDATSRAVNKVFGGGKGHQTMTTTATVNVGTDASTGSSNIYSNVYGGSALGAVGVTYVILNKVAALTGDVFGGGMGDASNAATVTDATNGANVTLNNVDLSSYDIYGGCNVNGTAAKTTVTLLNGKVRDVFGGGLGQNTGVTGNVTVNVGTYDASTTKISGSTEVVRDVYGGSAKGSVNKEEADATTKTTTTTVNLYAGQVGGNVYGGGLGDKASLGEGHSNIPAAVNGNVLVELNNHEGTCKVNGSIFGCNNVNGSPKGHVTTHIYKTVDRTGQTTGQYDVAAVYGGGNEADYIPTSSTEKTEVIIEGCDKTSIQYVYGGGNAASVPETEVTIKGTEIIDVLYGGGNGLVTPANVGFYMNGGTKTTTGTGHTHVKLIGGTINTVYGGSNSQGDVAGNATVDAKGKDDTDYDAATCCDKLYVGHVYGAGHSADVDGNVNILLECMPEDYVAEVFGGAEEASIEGNVRLIVTSGRFGRVFGGNNKKGNIKGTITVYVREEGCKPLEIGELFGGGYDAPYSKYGYTKTGDTWTENDETEDNIVKFDATEQYPYHVKVFVESCTSIGSIYGGGYGPTATVHGDTYVNVNMLYGSVDGVPNTAVGRIGQVFGGGKLANVKGDTKIDIGTETANEPTGVIITGTVDDNTKYLDSESDTYTSIPASEAGVYGGGKNADVLGKTTLNIGTKDLTDGTNITGNIFGGGYGNTTKVTGNVTVNIGKKEGTTVAGYATITGDVYGGSAMGTVNAYDNSGTLTLTTYPDPDDATKTIPAKTDVNLYGGAITGNVYGGGLGNDTYAANVFGPVTVTVKGGEVQNVFGCNNINGSPQQTADVVIDGGTNGKIYQSVYGGGDLAITEISPTVTVTSGTIGTAGLGGAVYGNVYGGGLGSDGTGMSSDLKAVQAGLVKGNTTVNINGGTILHNIYGGGAYGSVGTFAYDANGKITGYTSGGNTNIKITGGTIGTDGHENGMVFGSSRGDVAKPVAPSEGADPVDPNDKLAWVYDANVIIGTSGATTGPQINGSVYGSGENGHTYRNTDVKIYSGTIGINSSDNVTIYDLLDNTKKVYEGKAYNYPYRGNVYGGGCGTDMYDSGTDGTDDMYNPLAGIVRGTTLVTITGGQVVHNVYGAGAMGSVGTMSNTGAITSGGTTTIVISGGTVGVDGNGNGNVFGAARGDFTSTQPHIAQVSSTSVSMSNGTVYGNVYGGGEAGGVGTYTNTYTETGSKNYIWDKISEKEIGACAVEITGGTVKGHVFGAGKGEANTFECEKAMARATSVIISAGTVEKNVYGGGEVGRVDQDSKVTLGVKDEAKGSAAPTVLGSVFGAGAGKETHGYSALLRGNAEVILQGNAKVGKSVYGGGEIAAVGRYGLDGSGMPTTLVSGGECKVTVKGYADIGENVFGAGEGVVPAFVSGESKRMDNTGAWETFTDRYKYLAFLQTLALATDTKLSIEGNATVKGSVYGGSESGFVQRDTEVKIQGATGTSGSIIDGNIFGGGKGLSGFDAAGRVRGGVTIDVSGSTTHGSVYGGGELGIVVGAVKVDINNGTIEKDVYGGGALAHTNTNNWDGTTLTETYLEVAGLTVGTSSVVGYYTKSGDNYNEATGMAVANTTYYRKVNTSVNLLGGIIKGDAYGGGLGQLGAASAGIHYTQEEIDAASEGDPAYGKTTDDWKIPPVAASEGTGAIKALVYGDVAVTLGDDGRNGATAFYVDKYTEGTHAGIVKSGRVFGCNNLNGSPQRSVTVKVNKTVKGNIEKTASEDRKKENATHSYHIAAVYGGGNLAGKTVGDITNVIINGCDVSIRQVYGGGNAAEVPGTDVLVNGTYEIEQVFGGGNGKDDYTLDGGTTWITNPGANVNGNTNTLLLGGLIHEAYGGSNEKGTITGSVSINTGSGQPADCSDCPLDVEKIVGAGKNADVDGDLIMVLGCKPTTKTPLVFGGADNANVNGNVELTITSGTFGQVFGGNNLGGIIKGHIILNIEETGCNPIKIEELYLGGNQAAYSVYGYYDSGTTDPVTGKKIYKPRTSASDSHTADPSHADDATHSFPYADPVLNVVSCTSIDKVFGGGLGEGAVMYADPTVNINMIPGDFANDTEKGVPAVMTTKGLSADDNPKKLGIIGDVYGGGNAADVIGNTTVNIGTEPTVKLHQSYTTTGGYVMSDPITVEGAYINGNVYGGGKGSDDTYECEKAMVGINGDGEANPDGGTTVNIGNGVVLGSVYGGGEIGRVEKNSVVTIGLASGTSTPLIKGNVFGGGKGKETHGYAALLRGNPTVTIQADAKVLGNVYGGGEIASVARYKVPKTPAEVTAARAEGYDAILDMPYALKNSTSGYCTVTIKGNAEIGPDNMKMVHPEITDGTDKPDDAGHVFAAGKGILPENYPYDKEEDGHMPKRMINENGVDKWQWFHSKEDYVKFIQTLALSSNTEVTIDGNAFVKGSVYGGSENGLVQYDTKVYIKGGQIGNGDGVNRRYSDAEWAYDGSNDTKSLAECASWPYEAPYAPYDPNANATGDLDKYSSGKSTEGGRRLASDGHTYYGNVFGGGSGSVPYFDTDEGISKYLNSAGTVKGNTHVEISGGHILTSVYGGCEATNVQDTAYVTMTGGTVGVPRTLNQINNHPVTCYVFGGGKGDQRIFFNKDTNVGNSVVDIQGGRIYGSVFGGGEDGHVMRDVALTIGNDDGTGPTIGTWGTSYVEGNVFGGGRGFGGEALTAGNIGGSVTMNIKGGTMLGSIYGGGRLGSVGYGLYLVDEVVGEEKPYGVLRPDGVDDNGNPVEGFKRGYITINISGGTIGNEHEYKYYASDVELTSDMKTAANIPNTTFDYQNHLLYTKGGNVFTGCMGRLYALDGSTLLPLWPKLGKCKQTVLNITGGTIKSSVYGGGEIGVVQQNTTVNVTGGTVGTKVVDSEDETKYYYFGSVFGGGKGSTDAISYPAGTAEADKVDISEAGTVGGNVIVELNKGLAEDKPGGVVNQVFGCNDMNGSPKGMVDVHIYATQTVGTSDISTKLGKELGKYDVQAVYGGGNLAPYNPTDLTAGKAKVTIDGCGLSSIKQVYGGGNAASTPATEVTVNGTYEIDELFGGGNGADKLPNGSDNPGANVGFRAYLDNVEGKSDTPENRAANYGYGSGKAAVNVFGGTIHRVFGGSNTKGNVRKTAITMLEDKSGCPFCVDEAYGGGKSAPMDAEAKLLMACIPGLKAVYGGAQAADVYDDVTLTITNGNFDRVFGGNNISGTIRGRIQVNIEETGCKPVIIGELYGGGNQAGYSVYGYNADGSLITSGETPLYADPEVNVKSFTSIGNIYGGGYGTTATMVGNPTVNINEDEDATTDAQKHATAEYAEKTITLEANTENEHQVTLPKHTKGKMGAINNVFGGGNAAKVIGNTNVNIGTQTEGYMTISDTDITVGTTDVSNFYTRTGTTTANYVYTQATGTAQDGVTYYKQYTVIGADIRGNVYGGGNNAEVTGNTNVIIGKQAE